MCPRQKTDMTTSPTTCARSITAALQALQGRATQLARVREPSATLARDYDALLWDVFEFCRNAWTTFNDTHMALDFARRGCLKQICEVWPLHRMPEAVQKLKEGKVAGRIVIDFNADEGMQQS